MKTSWIIFIAFAYISIFYFAGVAQYSNLLTHSTMAGLQSLGQPSGTNWVLQQVAQISRVWTYLTIWFQMIFLWNPTVWSGSWYYFYLFVCLPVCIGMGMSIVFMLRGVHNS